MPNQKTNKLKFFKKRKAFLLKNYQNDFHPKISSMSPSANKAALIIYIRKLKNKDPP
jgi:hypothetical protein